MAIRRVFLAFNVCAPWPEKEPEGRLIKTCDRHVTVAFLGNVEVEMLIKQLNSLPEPQFNCGPVGFLDEPLLLPNEKRPRVFALHANWLTPGVEDYQKQVVAWLLKLEYVIDRAQRPWLPHVSLCRRPKNSDLWTSTFQPLPFYSTALHLYESCPDMRYIPIWSRQFPPPIVDGKEQGKTEEELRVSRKVAKALIAFKAGESPN